MNSRSKSKARVPARSRSAKQSAGLLYFRERGAGAVEVFLVHPGGPFWARKDDVAWSIPKGEFDEAESPLDAAKREFEEETGIAATGEFEPLAPVRQPSGKIVYAWAARGDFDASELRSNTFTIELPKGSGKLREFPEIDRGEWFPLERARVKLLKGQLPILEELASRLSKLP